jgi:hypothetical protein
MIFPRAVCVYDRAKGSERSEDKACRKSKSVRKMSLPRAPYDLPFLNEQQKRNILGGNAQRLFNLKPVLSDWKLQRCALSWSAAARGTIGRRVPA